MYNSIFIGLLMRITRTVQRIYSFSFLHKILFKFKTAVKRLYFNSKLSQFNKNIEEVFRDTKIYFVVGKIWNFIDWILNGLNSVLTKISNGSEIADELGYYTSNVEKGLKLVYLSSISVALILFIGRLIGFASVSIKINVAFFIIGIVGLLINGREKAAVNNSKVMSFIIGIFELDEGGENWW